jgi:hypothetical protein
MLSRIFIPIQTQHFSPKKNLLILSKIDNKKLHEKFAGYTDFVHFN